MNVTQLQENVEFITRRIDWIQDQICAGNLKVAEDEFKILGALIDVYEEKVIQLTGDAACTELRSIGSRPKNWYDQFLDPR